MKKNLIQISRHCSYLEYGENDRPNIGLVMGEDSYLVIDSGNSEENARLFLEAFSSDNKKGFLLLTHNHWDHICGGAYLPIPMIASFDTYRKILSFKERRWNEDGILSAFSEGIIANFTKNNMLSEYKLAKNKDFEIRLPDICLSGELIFNLGKCTCSYRPVTSCHCQGQYVLFVEEDKILFLGDILWPNMDSNESGWFYDYEVFEKMTEEVLSYDAETFVESHASPIGRNKLILWFQKMKFLMESVKFNHLNITDSIDKLPENLKEISFGYDNLILSAIENCR